MRFILLILISFSALLHHGWTDDYRQWYLPEGASKRLGKGNVIEITFSTDSKYLAVTSSIGIWLYDTQTCKETKLMTGDVNQLSTRVFNKITFSPDGKTLVSTSSTVGYSTSKPSIWFWDTDTGAIKSKLHRNPKGGTTDISSMVFSPDGNTLAFVYQGYKGSNIQLWDTRNTEYIGTFTDKQISPVIAFSPDGSTFASVDKEGTSIIFWDVVSSRKTKTIPTGHTKKVNWIKFLSDAILVIGDLHDTVRYLNINTLEHTEVKLTEKIKGKIHAFASTTTISAFANEDGVIQLWDMQNGDSMLLPTNNTSRITSLAISPNSLHLACARTDGTIQFYNTKTGKSTGTITGHKAGLDWYGYNYRNEFLAFSPDGTKLIGCGQLWDLNTGQSLAFQTGKFAYIYPTALSPDGKILASRSNEDIILSYTHSSVPKTILKGHFYKVECIAFSPDGKTLASGSAEQSSGGNKKPVTIRLWNTLTGEQKMTLTGHTGKVTSIAFSPDGKTLASGSEDNTIRLWDPDIGEMKFGLIGKKGVITCIAFSPDGNIIAGGNGSPRNRHVENPDTTIQLWDAKTGKEITVLTGDVKDVLCIAFSPDGKTLASGSKEKTIRLWDISTAQHIETFKGHVNPVYSVAFSPDGETLASSSGNGTILLWNLVDK